MDLLIGHYTDTKAKTGCTVFIFPTGAAIGIDIRGSNTATLNTPAYDCKSVQDTINAVVLTGGSTYGLESAFGVMQWLEEHEIGHMTRAGRIIPSITGAVIYDLGEGRADTSPDKQAGYYAAHRAIKNNDQQGQLGVGTGAVTGKWLLGSKRHGGFAMSSVRLPGNIEVRAYVVTNSVGDVIDSSIDLRVKQKAFHKLTNFPQYLSGTMDLDRLSDGKAMKNTTLAVIATNAQLTKHELSKVAELAHDGMARAIYPVHTTMDGDVIFAVSVPPCEKLDLPHGSLVDFVGMAAADALSQAIMKSVS